MRNVETLTLAQHDSYTDSEIDIQIFEENQPSTKVAEFILLNCGKLSLFPRSKSSLFDRMKQKQRLKAHRSVVIFRAMLSLFLR